MRYTYMPNTDDSEGVWGACGVNEKNVSMSATETITTNAGTAGGRSFLWFIGRVKNGEPEVPGGIGEEDMVTITLPYISSAREG